MKTSMTFLSLTFKSQSSSKYYKPWGFVTSAATPECVNGWFNIKQSDNKCSVLFFS